MIEFKTPARVCFFGDHQDYLDLPVIAGTINRYIHLKAIPSNEGCLLYTSPSPRDRTRSRMPSSA